MSTEKRSRRTEAEILADLQSQLESAKLRAAQESAKDNPVLESVMEALKSATSDITKARKKFAPSNVSNFDRRIQSHQIWIDEIRADELMCNAELELELIRKDFYQDTLTEAANMLSSEDYSDSDVQAYIDSREVLFVEENSYMIDAVNTLSANYDAAHEARREFIDNKKNNK